MSDPVITVENLSKAYCIGLRDEIPDTLVGAAASWAKAPWRNYRRLRRLNTFRGRVKEPPSAGDGCLALDDDVLWALRAVSFEVHRGDVVGIIGRNGAGKSTLLKILSRITEPTCGRVLLRGRVSSLLEVGTGFHEELTGRENVYMNGTILGMTKREIDRSFEEIVDFSGVEMFLDTAVKRYSSGMKVRLAFAVAAHLNPEVLLVDEVLAVGDAEFQKKCLGKMHDVACAGRTVLFVSHNMAALRSLTSCAVYLRRGQLVFQGQTEKAIDTYLAEAIANVSCGGRQMLDYYRRSPNPSSPVRFSRVWLESAPHLTGKLPRLRSGDSITLAVEIESDIALLDACVSVALIRNQEQRVVTLLSLDHDFEMPLARGRQVFACSIHGLPLTAGTYTLTSGITRNPSAAAFDVIVDYPLFEIEVPEIDSGEIHWPHRPWGAVKWDAVRWQRR
jgi:lipopolysaccharide transport system ATP-binding protein